MINDYGVPLSRNDVMPIEIKIVYSPDSVSVGKPSYSFPDAGGTLGRGSDNFWVLDDPSKYMSSVHAKISSVAEQYFLTDMSTNGTFVNGAAEPVGNGNQVLLNDGDRFAISDYEFIANISNELNGPSPFQGDRNTDPFADLHSPLAIDDDFNSQVASENDPFASAVNPTSSMSAFDSKQVDPIALLDQDNSPSDDPFAKQGGGYDSFAQDAFAQDGEIDSSRVVNDAIDWPVANQQAGLIPDDWDDWDESEAIVTANTETVAPIPIPTPSKPDVPRSNQTEAECIALKQKNKQLLDEVSQLKAQLVLAKNQLSAAETNSTNGMELNTVVNAMGLSKWNLDNKKVAEINETVGLLMRETMQGMMQVLKFRKKIKEEFRINVTTIQSIENNPLKFSANIEDAMENMFIKENNAYKAPVDAVKEGFQGIAEHQVAVVAGMQAAFRGMIERFNPTNLESRFEKYKSLSLLSIGNKSKRWNAYKEYHRGLVDNLDDSFQHLFGYDFVQAYEDQMQRLISARVSPDNDDQSSK
ncbi:MAG: type VI secretion system protein [Psychromonas sp.]